ncbi:hypothetical protein N7509_010136 [Penicillium cosmopolitanum]|uniref:DUF7514 domain-containing protein n=1 Tax=Penicillium cosmopolitanum TaxID=1131564 RepID=A0A9W9VR05_9EURO|nr:uncharacterized protein N7509_010136 [Penicillium cosmopolitanum]KAJ5387595.1 hypothetical protein N7509_010136 [Penicillium cosmopolitanum]
MAYDGYRSTPNPYQTGNMTSDPTDPYGPPHPPYPSRHENDYLNMPQLQMPQPASATSNMDQPYPEPPRPESTNSGHLNDAISSAVHSNESSAYLSPDVLQQITATVIQQLKASGLENSNLPGSGSGSGQPPARSQSLQPPYSAADLAPRPHSESPPIASQRSGSVPFVDPMSKSYDTHPYVPPSAYSNDPRSRTQQSPESFSRRRESMSSQGSQAPRPKGPERDTTVMEMTTLERIWGKLFEDGKPTKRLGQFLRGIAMHLIEDYPPGNTLVIVPDKLQKFYADTNVSLDKYPWKDIFDDRTSSISRLFRDVEVEHHLVQSADLKERPDIPGLTPKGFEKWATMMIQAHPDREYERLQKAVLNMPISNPDDKKERFPKEIPRRLFPDTADIQLREETEEYIMKHCGVDLPRITEEERELSRPSTAKRSPEPAISSSGRARSYERGRPPHTSASASAASSSAVIDDEDEEVTPSVSIERERKPYSAHPGGGKQYKESGSGHSRTGSSTSSFSTSRPADITGTTSTSNSTSEPLKHRPAEKFDRDSRYGRTGSGPASRRFSRTSRSSSRGMNTRPGDYRHSESDLHSSRDNTPRYEGISAADLYMESPTSVLPDSDDGRRFKDHRSSRSGDDYYRGMLGGHGGGPVKYYH